MTIGIICAVLAMFSWGIGDFLIQRSLRRLGDFETIFIISLFGTLVLLPFVWNDLSILFSLKTMSAILIGAGFLLFIAASTEFEALRRGKISVIEPTWSLEIPTTILFAFLILGERLSIGQIALITSLLIGLFLVSYRGKFFTKNFLIERGVSISIFAAILMGGANFMVAWGAREANALLVSFAVSIFSLIGTGIILTFQHKLLKTFRGIKRNPKEILIMCLLDNGAWIAFAFAMTYAPIGLVVALSESYIIIAVLLGLLVNKEKIERHQRLGLMMATISAIIIAVHI